MTDFTDYTEGQIRDWMSQGVATDTPPDPIFVAVHTADPGESPDGTTEPGSGGYDRVSTAAGTDWNTPTENDFANASNVTFPQATGDWGTITHVSLWNANDGTGSALAAYALDASVDIMTDDTLEFQAGDLSFSID